MPVLIDGNNLLHAACQEEPERPPGRALLCHTLSAWSARTGHSARLVFDGPAPQAGFAAQIDRAGVMVQYSPDRSADCVLIEILENDSAARSLTVVSSDRAIQRAARRRRARVIGSSDFWRLVQRELARRQPDPSIEPPEKRIGPGPRETAAWLEEFGFRKETGESNSGDMLPL